MSNAFDVICDYPSAKGLEEHFALRFQAIRAQVLNMLPCREDDETLVDFVQRIQRDSPMVVMSEIEDNSLPATFTFCVICDGGFTHGTGRFVTDCASRFLVPGKQLTIVSSNGSTFKIKDGGDQNFFIVELIIKVQNPGDIKVIEHNFQNVADNIRLSIMAVKHARQIVKIKPLNLEQKKIILQENLASLFNRPAKDNHTMFDQAYSLILKAAGEETMSKMQEELAPLMELKPHTFDRDIFSEIQNFVRLFREDFSAIRDHKHLKRIISYQYLFKKILLQGFTSDATRRQTSIKLLRTHLTIGRFKQPVLGVLVGLNFVAENEIFEKRHLLKALQGCFPHLIYIEDSFISDTSGDPRIRTYYIEVKKRSRTSFTQSDLAELKKRLPREITDRIETVVHPVFMHRNEEEVMRGILDLAKQLKYVDDIPQVIVNFHRQTATDLSFTVILLRLQKGEDGSLKDILKASPLNHEVCEHEVKIVGILKKRYTKEANIFDIRMEKKSFLRSDYSVDLYKARQTVILELTNLLGEIRDYNGGMISKQNEVLSHLKKRLQDRNISNDFLLENFFYSISPAYMQSLLAPSTLSTLFFMLLEVLEHDFTSDPFYSSAQIIDDTFLIMLGCGDQSLIEMIEKHIDQIKHSHPDLTKSLVNTYEIYTLGYILKFDNSSEYVEFRNTILEAIQNWQENITKLEKNTALR
ncbi:MAG: hypothetical protein SP1CHLAM54_05900 [Chlamydiia bacterium]|nr:hypothetical protein [Chlamydiia bacterium]MCH9615500.1 hypothetical protein [Chlamydiia bacterium]MCH9629155.1 hypothetical protein [Chlamydiia bacterium]